MLLLSSEKMYKKKKNVKFKFSFSYTVTLQSWGHSEVTSTAHESLLTDKPALCLGAPELDVRTEEKTNPSASVLPLQLEEQQQTMINHEMPTFICHL